MRFLQGLKHGMHLFGQHVGVIVNTVLLAFVYCIGVGLSALGARLAGKRMMELRINRRAKTYWTDLNLGKQSLEEGYRQF